MDNLSQKAIEARRAYNNEYRRRNPEKTAQYRVSFWERKAASYTIDQKAKDLQAEGYTQREISTLLKISLGAVNKCVNKD